MFSVTTKVKNGEIERRLKLHASTERKLDQISELAMLLRDEMPALLEPCDQLRLSIFRILRETRERTPEQELDEKLDEIAPRKKQTA